MISSGEGATPEAASEGLISSDVADGDAVPEGSSEGGAKGTPGDAGAPSGAPEAYVAFDLAEGVHYSDAQLQDGMTLFKDLNLSQAQAQKLVNFQTDWAQKLGQQNQEATAKALSTVQAGWAEQVRNDADLGGENLEGSRRLVKAALVNVAGGKELEEVLDKFGLTNHPIFFKYLASVGKGMSSDSAGRGGEGAGSSDAVDEYGLTKATRTWYENPTPN